MKAPIPLVVRVDDLDARSTSQSAFLKSPVRIGRGELNDLRLDHPYVSTWHGVVAFDDDGISFVDLGSMNGTTVNDARLERNVPTRIGPEDDVRIGSLRLHLARREVAAGRPEPRRPSTQFAKRAPALADGPAVAAPAPAAAVQAPAGPDRAVEALEAASWQLGILHDACAQARRNLDEALHQALAALPEPDRRRALALASERYPGGAPGVPPPAGGGGALAPAALQLLRAFAESYLPQEAALDSADGLEGFLGATAELLETAAKSYLELRRGYEEFGREMGIRVAAGDGPVARAKDARGLLAWLLQPVEGEPRARELASGFADLMIHQVALLNAVTEGGKELVSRLSPEAVTARLEREGGSRLALGVKPLREGAQWRAFVGLYREVAEEEGALSDALFGKAFVRAYSAVSGRRSGPQGPEPEGTTPRPGGRGKR